MSVSHGKGVLTMISNMGSIDRIVRAAVAAIIVLAILTSQVTGLAAIVLGVLAVILAATSAVAWCPLYLPFHISTRRHA